MVVNGRLGCYWYVGETQSGKSKKAFADLQADVLGTGRPFLIIDPMPAWNFEHMHHEETWQRVLWKLYERGAHAVFTPNEETGDDDVSRLMRAIRKAGNVHVLFDEASFFMSKDRISKSTSRALRGWAHSHNTFRMVTQRPGDIHGDAYACDPEVYAFKTRKVSDRERLRDEFDFDMDALKWLREGEFLTYKKGF